MTLVSRNTIANFVGQTLVLVVGFVSFRLTYKELGEDAVGIIYFSILVSTTLAGALELGIAKATIREVAAKYNHDRSYVRDIVQTFSFLYWGLYGAALLALLALIPAILEGWLNLASMSSQVAANTLAVVGGTSLLVIPRSLMASVFIGVQRMHVNNAINVTSAFLQQAGIVAILNMDGSIGTVAHWIGATNILAIAVYYFFAGQVVSASSLVPVYRHGIIAGRLKSYLSHMAFVSLLNMLTKQADKILMSVFLPIGNLGVYSFVFLTVTKLTLVTDSLLQAIFPHFSKLHIDREEDVIKSELAKYFDILAFGLIPIFALPAFMSVPLLTLLMDKGKAEDLVVPLAFLSIAFYINGMNRLFNIYLSSVGETIHLVRGSLIIFSLTPITAFLVYKYGIAGAGFSWLVIQISGLAFVMFVIFRNKPALDLVRYLRSTFKAVSSGSIVFFSLWWLFGDENPGLIHQSFLFVCASLMYFGVAILMSDGGFYNAVIEAHKWCKSVILRRSRL